ncbi:uridine kinase [Antrihabitans cavernicola]|uniref:Uridine kinase n=1 Tax=Antrihabitans cavernicola TaxID=2495913 RepID=A0A5A7SDQ9_9NOCA|nr:uridine kinase [Spelaeibacter cavernicola]
MIGGVARYIAAQRFDRPLRIAIDGITAAGKTTLANELAAGIEGLGRPTIRLSMDGFHRPRDYRHRQGRDSAIGYYQDAYDFDAFARHVLTPLGPGGDRRYRERIIDLVSDQPIREAPALAEADAVVVVDGSFLQTRELAGLWDEVVFVDTTPREARERGVRRDAGQLGGPERAAALFDLRYHAACRIYVDDVDPRSAASVVIDNDDVERPILVRLGPG